MRFGGLNRRILASNGVGIGDAAITNSMTHKQSFFVVVFTMLMAVVVARLKAAYDKHIPEGFQDDTGFHLGHE